jgi:hypothetical protein
MLERFLKIGLGFTLLLFGCLLAFQATRTIVTRNYMLGAGGPLAQLASCVCAAVGFLVLAIAGFLILRANLHRNTN